MLFTLTASCIRDLFESRGSRKPRMSLLDVPRFVRETLSLHGLNLSTDLLSGATRETLEAVRDRGDKAGCSCLLLDEPQPLPFGDEDEERAEGAVQRMLRVVEAAQLLGCNSAALRVLGADDEGTFERAADQIRRVVERAERLEINVLVAPHEGLTQTADRVTDFIKRIGGFRIGTFPDFQAAVESGDPVTYLRRLTPYASVVQASTVEFAEPAPEQAAPGPKKPKQPEPEDAEDGDLEEEAPEPVRPAPRAHTAYDLRPLMQAVSSVGYDGTLAIDYRGNEDSTLGVIASREALEAAVEALAEGK